MAHRGLRNRGRDGHYPAKAVTVWGMAHLLAHRAYVGIVEWDGVEYEGSHEPLVDRTTFDKVQELLASRAMRGTRERRHHHYLKGLLVCGVCGRRLSIQCSKGTYTYFYCLVSIPAFPHTDSGVFVHPADRGVEGSAAAEVGGPEFTSSRWSS